MSSLFDKKAVIFDLDGTLIDSMESWSRVENLLTKKIAQKSIPSGWDAATFRGQILAKYSGCEDAYEAYYAALAEFLGTKMSVAEIRQMRREISSKIVTRNVRFQPGAVDLLRFLKKSGCKLALATMSGKQKLLDYCHTNNHISQEISLLETFDVVLTRNDVNCPKPNPEIYLKVLDHLKISSKEALVVEDSLCGVDAAVAAGIDTVAVEEKTSAQNLPIIRKKVQKVYACLNDLCADLQHGKSLSG